MTRILPKICTELDFSSKTSSSSAYLALIKKSLKKILPETFFELYENVSIDQIQNFFSSLFPLTCCEATESFPANFTYTTLFKYRANAFKFCFEMLSRWLVPGKRLNVLLIYAVDFSFPEFGDELYTLFEIILRVENKQEQEEIQKNLPIIESEIALGVTSSYYARKILEIKGLSSDEKIAMIQEYIASMIFRRPKAFSYDVFAEMQHVLVVCRDDFKTFREVRHLGRIICVQYLLRKTLRESLREFPHKRHLFIKLFKAKLNLVSGRKPVLGLIVAVNFLRDKEVFEEAHLVKAVKAYIPKAQAVPSSYFFCRRGSEPICTLYLEIEKGKGGEDFSAEEIALLRRELVADLEGGIERLVHPIFMPRNEEEVMRNILTLGQQIRFVSDTPQMFITFDEQTHTHLFFTVILVNVVKANTASVQEMFNRSDSSMEYVHDRCKTIGYLRKKHKKEATVFRLKMRKEHFLRRDHSIDLYKARQAAVAEISRIVGPVRDYNGGMISKQSELLNMVKDLLKARKKYNEVLLENFFYSLNPVIMRTVLEPEELKKLFVLLIETIEKVSREVTSEALRIQYSSHSVFVLLVGQGGEFETHAQQSLAVLNTPGSMIASSCVYVKDVSYLCYIYRSDDVEKQKQFCAILTELSNQSFIASK